MTAPFPFLTPCPRTGNALCGSRPADTAPTCGAPAAWHVAWTLTAPAQFSLLCNLHMGWAQQQLVYVDRHPSTVACDMPSTGWLVATPSRCVPVTTEDVRHAEHTTRPRDSHTATAARDAATTLHTRIQEQP